MSQQAKPAVPEFMAKYGVKPSEWQYAAKGDWQFLMRPGFDLRVRVYACLQEFTRGYPSGGGEFAMRQVARAFDGKPKFAPISPTLIIARLQKVASDEQRRSGLDPNEEENHKVQGTILRRVIESMESQDGCLTRVTLLKFLHREESTRKQGWADVQRLMTEGLSYDEARAQHLIVPISELSKTMRKKLAGKSFIYLHFKPRPATVAALRRRTNDDVAANTKTVNGLQIEATTGVQTYFRFLREKGVEDPRLAAELAERPDGRAHLNEIAGAKQALREAETSTRAFVARAISKELPPVPVSAAPPADVQAPLFPPQLVQSSAAVNPAGTVASSASPSATAADPHTPPPEGRQAGTVTPERDRASRSAPPSDRETGCTPEEVESPAEVYAVLGAMRKYSAADADAASDLIERCRKHAPNCTVVSICEAVQIKGPMAKEKTNPVGMLLTAVPKLFTRAVQKETGNAPRERRCPCGGEIMDAQTGLCWKCTELENSVGVRRQGLA